MVFSFENNGKNHFSKSSLSYNNVHYGFLNLISLSTLHIHLTSYNSSHTCQYATNKLVATKLGRICKQPFHL